MWSSGPDWHRSSTNPRVAALYWTVSLSRIRICIAQSECQKLSKVTIKLSYLCAKEHLTCTARVSSVVLSDQKLHLRMQVSSSISPRLALSLTTSVCRWTLRQPAILSMQRHSTYWTTSTQSVPSPFPPVTRAIWLLRLRQSYGGKTDWCAQDASRRLVH